MERQSSTFYVLEGHPGGLYHALSTERAHYRVLDHIFFTRRHPRGNLITFSPLEGTLEGTFFSPLSVRAALVERRLKADLKIEVSVLWRECVCGTLMHLTEFATIKRVTCHSTDYNSSSLITGKKKYDVPNLAFFPFHLPA